MKFYRIKQVDENWYIPQIKRCLLCSWDDIDALLFEALYYEEGQISHCSPKTLEEARQRIAEYKEEIKNKKKFPKYFKA